jgi:DNA-binding CsgD family transcriptional regulator
MSSPISLPSPEAGFYSLAGDVGEAPLVDAHGDGRSGPITEATVLKLVGQIYEAAVDPSRWPDFLQAFGRAVQGQGTLIFSHNVETFEVTTAEDATSPTGATGFAPEFMKSLGEYYNSVNVWAQNEAVLKPGRAVTGSMLFPARELPKTEWYNDWLRPQDLFHAIGGLIVQDGPWAVKFSCLRSPRMEDYVGEEMQLYQALLPHLARAARVQRRFAFLQSLSTSSLGLLEMVPHAVMLLDASARVLHVNAAAEAELRRADPLRFTSSGQLECRGAPRLRTALWTAIRAVLDPVRAARENLSPVAQLSRRNGHLLSVQAVPLPAPAASGAIATLSSRLAACALIVQPAPSPARVPFSERYGLTPAESKVASLIAKGKLIPEVARDLGVSPNTVKSQLRAIYLKTDTRRQGELIRLFLREGSDPPSKQVSAPAPEQAM